MKQKDEEREGVNMNRGRLMFQVYHVWSLGTT